MIYSISLIPLPSGWDFLFYYMRGEKLGESELKESIGELKNENPDTSPREIQGSIQETVQSDVSRALEREGYPPEEIRAAAGYIAAFRDADALRNRATKATQERISRLQAKGIRTPEDEVTLT